MVPHWVKDKKQLKELVWNKTLNARGETIFEKPSFRESAKHNRCLIYGNKFYEHHHLDGKTVPFYIHQKNDKPLALAWLNAIEDEMDVLTNQELRKDNSDEELDGYIVRRLR